MRVPIVAVPTTYAGSEMTPVWGRTEDGEKRTGHSADVVARVVVYDPELTAGLPPAITAASGMNALAHAVGRSRADPVTALVAREAVRALTAGLPRAVAGEDRVEALYGAYLAASAFAVAGSGPAPQDLPRARRHVRPAARADPRRAAALHRGRHGGRPARAGRADRRADEPAGDRHAGRGPRRRRRRLPPDSARQLLTAAYDGKWPA